MLWHQSCPCPNARTEIYPPAARISSSLGFLTSPYPHIKSPGPAMPSAVRAPQPPSPSQPARARAGAWRARRRAAARQGRAGQGRAGAQDTGRAVQGRDGAQDAGPSRQEHPHGPEEACPPCPAAHPPRPGTYRCSAPCLPGGSPGMLRAAAPPRPPSCSGGMEPLPARAALAARSARARAGAVHPSLPSLRPTHTSGNTPAKRTASFGLCYSSS